MHGGGGPGARQDVDFLAGATVGERGRGGHLPAEDGYPGTPQELAGKRFMVPTNSATNGVWGSS